MTTHNTQRIAFAIMLPRHIATLLHAIQQKNNLPLWQPKIDLHITLVSPFTTSETIGLLRHRMMPIKIRRKPFRVVIACFGRFDNEESIFYAAVKPSVSLTTLADDVLTAVIDLHRPRTRPFIPHVTLAAPASRITVNRYLKQTQKDIPYLIFTCDRFSMLKFDEKLCKWNITHTFKFIT